MSATSQNQRRWSWMGPRFDRWKSRWERAILNLKTLVVVKASQAVTPCLRQQRFLGVRSLSRAMDKSFKDHAHRDLGSRDFVDLRYGHTESSLCQHHRLLWIPMQGGHPSEAEDWHIFFLCFPLVGCRNFEFLPHATRLQNVSFGFWRVIFRLKN